MPKGHPSDVWPYHHELDALNNLYGVMEPGGGSQVVQTGGVGSGNSVNIPSPGSGNKVVVKKLICAYDIIPVALQLLTIVTGALTMQIPILSGVIDTDLDMILDENTGATISAPGIPLQVSTILVRYYIVPA